MSTTPTLTQLRAAAATLRKAGHPEVAEYLRVRAKQLWKQRRFERGIRPVRVADALKQAEDLARCADPNDEGAEVDSLPEPPGGWQGGDRP